MILKRSFGASSSMFWCQFRALFTSATILAPTAATELSTGGRRVAMGVLIT